MEQKMTETEMRKVSDLHCEQNLNVDINASCTINGQRKLHDIGSVSLQDVNIKSGYFNPDYEGGSFSLSFEPRVNCVRENHTTLACKKKIVIGE